MRQPLTDDTGTPAGWTIVSVGDDGSVLCQSPSGKRRRYWFQSEDNDRLRVENERLRQIAELVILTALSADEQEGGDAADRLKQAQDEAKKLLGRV